MRVWPYIVILVIIVIIRVGARYYAGTRGPMCNAMMYICPDGSAQQRLNDGTCDLAPCPAWIACDEQTPCPTDLACVNNTRRQYDPSYPVPGTFICVRER